jgi:hypothetical protein
LTPSALPLTQTPDSDSCCSLRTNVNFVGPTDPPFTCEPPHRANGDAARPLPRLNMK